MAGLPRRRNRQARKRGETHTTEARDNRRGIPQGSPSHHCWRTSSCASCWGGRGSALSDVSALASSPKTLGYPYFDLCCAAL